jgi:hypothetical protein
MKLRASQTPNAQDQPSDAVGRARKLCYASRTTVEDIERAIEGLAPQELDRLRTWFEEFQAARFDDKIERDARAGKLDRLAEDAIADFRKGRASAHVNISARQIPTSS